MNIKHFTYLTLITLSVSACSNTAKKNGIDAETPETYSDKKVVLEPNATATKKTKDDFGVLEIKQDGPGYEINLALDTGDDNVNFTMDLPEQSSASNQVEQQLNARNDTENDTNTLIKKQKATTSDEGFLNNNKPSETAKTQTQLNNEQLIENTLQQGPSANDYLVSAQTQFYEDNYMGALSDIEHAIEKDNTQALSFAIKGSILYKLGNKSAAKIAWEQALYLNPKLKSVELSLQYLVGQ